MTGAEPVPRRSERAADIAIALLAAVACHGGFVVAVTAMIAGLAGGLHSGLGRVPAPFAAAVNALLILQFPLVHSGLLTGRGRRLLAAAIPGRRGRTLAPTLFATIASLQLLALFVLWTPGGTVWWEPTGALGVASWTAFTASWLFLIKALADAGMELQTGSLGWFALLRGRPPVYPALPTGGLFEHCRQPIYLGFFAILWTAPTWTPDHLALALAWSPYCLFAPRLKEKRFLRSYGSAFADYRQRVPYFFPRLVTSRAPNPGHAPRAPGA